MNEDLPTFISICVLSGVGVAISIAILFMKVLILSNNPLENKFKFRGRSAWIDFPARANFLRRRVTLTTHGIFLRIR